jgi:nucleotide-binding universal stress UspA family protein
VAARSCPDAIVVMATHRRPPLERLLYGSIADHLVRRSSVPVLLVGDREASARGVDRVILPLDGSADAEAAVAPAVDVAGPVDYLLLHIEGESGHEATVPRPSSSAAGGELDASFDRVCRFLEERGATASVRVVHARRPATGILEHARAGDMIAMTPHHSRLARALFGSTTDEVSRRAPDVALLLCRDRAHPPVQRRAGELRSPNHRAARAGAYRWNRGAPRPERRPAARSGLWTLEGGGAP